MHTRLTTFDIAKGIGIVLVVLGHALRGLENAGISVPYYESLDQVIYSFHMPLFFVISGYFISKSVAKKPASTLIKSKIHTLMYPYLVWMLIQGFIEFAMSSYTNGNVELWRVFVVWLPRAHFWFLYILMFFSAVYIVAAKFHSKSPILLFGLSLLLYFTHFDSDSNLYYLYLYIRENLIFFLLGALLPHFITKITQPQPAVSVMTSALLCVALQYIGLTVKPDFYPLTQMIDLLLALSTIALVFQLSSLLSQKGTPLWLKLGELSMPIYLAHIIFASGLRIVLVKLGIDDPSIHVLLGTLVGLVGPIALFYVSKTLRFNSLFNSPFIKAAN